VGSTLCSPYYGQTEGRAQRTSKEKPGRRWKTDETYLKVGKKHVYLYRAIDEYGNLVEVWLSATRDLAAEAFFRQAVETTGRKPTQVTSDKHSSYPKAIRKILDRTIEHRTSKYLNNPTEADHRGIKARYKPMLGFKRFESASRFCSVYDEVRNYLRYWEFRNDKGSLSEQRSLFRQRFAYIQHLLKTA